LRFETRDGKLALGVRFGGRRGRSHTGLKTQDPRLKTEKAVPANIVEGSARHTEKEFLNFLNIAYGSLAEVGYFIDLSLRLGFLGREEHAELKGSQEETSRMLNGLMRSLRKS